MTYPEYIHNLPVVEKTIEDEIKANGRFAILMRVSATTAVVPVTTKTYPPFIRNE